MEHKKLVNLAIGYLSAKQCNPVFSERGSARISEMPDVIGWNSECIIIECKTTISDLKTDAKKPFRSNGKGMGNRRFYLFPCELYEYILRNKKDNMILEGWGVLTITENHQIRQFRFKNSKRFRSNIKAERDYLRSRILQIQRFGK